MKSSFLKVRVSKSLFIVISSSIILSILVQPLIALKTSALGTYPNASIANRALGYTGQWGGNACKDVGRSGYTGGYPGGQTYDGQCRAFVNCVVWSVSNRTQWLGGGDYFSPLAANGHEIKDINGLVKGDVIQVGQGTHTFIIVGRTGGNIFRVVDSNSRLDEVVRTYDRKVTLDNTNRAFRLGLADGPQPTVNGGVGTRLLGDVNGDGLDDAIVMFKDTGTAMVALSQGSSFSNPSAWSYGHSMNASNYFLADVNGDKKKDLVGFFAQDGRWKVSLSSGTGFWSPVEWAYGQGVGTSNQWLMDANGDAKADIITLDKQNGDWYVSSSSGSGFWPPKRWISGHGVGSDDQAAGDFNGDGRADVAIWLRDGSWYVALSTGSTFGYPGHWSAGQGLNSSQRLVGDANGDGRADTAYFYADTGRWYVSTSSGSGFWTPTEWAYGQGVGTTERFLGTTTKDSLADMVTFDRNTGDWWVSVSSGSGFWPPSRWISGHGKAS